MKNEITFLILSWKRNNYLEESLNSYWNLIKDFKKIIYFNEYSEQDKQSLSKFDLTNTTVLISKKNNKIGNSLLTMLKHCNTNQFVFLENDWKNVSENFLKTLNCYLKIMLENKIDFVKLRSRKNYGNPLYSLHLKGNEFSEPHFILDSLHWIDNFESYYKDKIQFEKYQDLYCVSSKYGNYSNNPFLCRKTFFLDKISEFCFNMIEENINKDWWKNQNFRIAQGNGIFKHIGDRK